MERALRDEYEAIVDEVAASVTAENAEAALALLAYPERIRGFGPVRAEGAKLAQAKLPGLVAAYRSARKSSDLAAAE